MMVPPGLYKVDKAARKVANCSKAFVVLSRHQDDGLVYLGRPSYVLFFLPVKMLILCPPTFL